MNAAKLIKLGIQFGALTLLLSLAGCGEQPDPDLFIKQHIINPLPEDLVHHSTIEIFQPVFGGGALTAAYTADEKAWDLIWAAGDWKIGYRNLAFEQKATNLFYSVWPTIEKPFEVYHIKSQGPPMVCMLVSPEHRELLFSIFE